MQQGSKQSQEGTVYDCKYGWGVLDSSQVKQGEKPQGSLLTSHQKEAHRQPAPELFEKRTLILQAEG